MNYLDLIKTLSKTARRAITAPLETVTPAQTVNSSCGFAPPLETAPSCDQSDGSDKSQTLSWDQGEADRLAVAFPPAAEAVQTRDQSARSDQRPPATWTEAELAEVARDLERELGLPIGSTVLLAPHRCNDFCRCDGREPPPKRCN
jgi:hypothetical protein